MTVDELKRSGWILMEAVVGSQSFGLATEKSDTDVRGVFVLPMEERISFSAFDQVADEKNNNVYWELKKFLQLLREGNPSALEFLNSPSRCILQGQEWFDFIDKPIWVTERCAKSFLEYAKNQLSRAYGLNKKVFNPWPEEAPKVLDYCYVLENNLAVPFRDWLKSRPYECKDEQKYYAIAAIDHVTDTYALYWENVPLDTCEIAAPEHEWRWAYGVVSDEDKANDIQLSSIPKGIPQAGILFFNRNAYSHACSEHTKYWKWVKDRNPERYDETVRHGQGYDAKNTMHCIRLLMTAKKLAETGRVQVDWTSEREYLLAIKAGKFTYDEMMAKSDALVAEVAEAFRKSTNLKPVPDDKILDDWMESILVRLPDRFNRLIQENMEASEDDIE
jgi:hypothetical protein